MDRCGALISVMCACARLAMNSCSASGMTWSAVPMMAHDGIVSQAGVVVSVSPSADSASGCCSAASAAASPAGSPLTKQPGNALCLMYRSTSPGGLPGYGTPLSIAGVTHDPATAEFRDPSVSPADGRYPST